MDKEKNKNNNEKKSTKKTWLIISALIIILAIAGITTYFLLNQNKDEKDESILAYTDLIKEISYGNIEKIEMTVESTTV